MTNITSVEGVIASVSEKFGSLRLRNSERWYPLGSDIKDQAKHDLKGRAVRLDIDEEGHVRALSELSATSSELSVIITRQVCLKAAARYCGVRGHPVDELFQLAERMEKWIRR